MQKSLLKNIVTASYTGNILDVQKIERIVAHLSRKELKQYIRALKAHEKKNSVFITTAKQLDKDKQILNGMFPEKRLIFHVDPSLIVGIKVEDNDILYEMSLRNSLRELGEYVNE